MRDRLLKPTRYTGGFPSELGLALLPPPCFRLTALLPALATSAGALNVLLSSGVSVRCSLLSSSATASVVSGCMSDGTSCCSSRRTSGAGEFCCSSLASSASALCLPGLCCALSTSPFCFRGRPLFLLVVPVGCGAAVVFSVSAPSVAFSLFVVFGRPRFLGLAGVVTVSSVSTCVPRATMSSAKASSSLSGKPRFCASGIPASSISFTPCASSST